MVPSMRFAAARPAEAKKGFMSDLPMSESLIGRSLATARSAAWKRGAQVNSNVIRKCGWDRTKFGEWNVCGAVRPILLRFSGKILEPESGAFSRANSYTKKLATNRLLRSKYVALNLGASHFVPRLLIAR